MHEVETIVCEIAISSIHLREVDTYFLTCLSFFHFVEPALLLEYHSPDGPVHGKLAGFHAKGKLNMNIFYSIRRFSRFALLAFVLMMLVPPSGLRAGDWPQILGPTRNGVADGERLAQKWPASGPQQLWEEPVGSGYAGPAVSGQSVILFHRFANANLERLEARHVDDGRRLWHVEFDINYRCRMNEDSGPRCVPIIDGERVFAFGAAGSLVCVDLASGEHQWTRDLYDDYRGDEGYFGAGSTPIVVGDKILVNVGGHKDAGLVAVDKRTGETVWTAATNQKASYSSPVLIPLNGQPYVLFLTKRELWLVDPKNGSVNARVPFGKSGATVNAALPLVFGDHVFLTASYGIGAVVAQCKQDDVQVVWRAADVISSQYNSCVFRDGHVFGIHGREDVGTAHLRCVRTDQGTVSWTQSGFGVAHLILADNGILALTSGGELVLFEANSQSYRELQRSRIIQATTRALPALANGRLYVRSNGSDRNTLRVFQVGA